MIKHTRRITVVVVMVLLCGVVAAQDVEMIESHLGNEGPAFQEDMTPSSLGWGPDDQAYPDRFVVYPQDGSELVWVPPGSFPMGSTEQQIEELVRPYSGAVRELLKDTWRAETPQREVEMDGFWIQKHTITNAQYRAFCEATGRTFPARSDQGDAHPATHVSWDDAVAYADHYGLSLPTEAQWEYTARGPEGQIYPWGDEWDPEKLCWAQHKGPGGTSFPVGSFPDGASWVGALDMAGNVWEWCADWYSHEYYRSAPRSNPPGPAEGLRRVVRGGCWHSEPRDLRAALRLDDDSIDRPQMGFRCVRGL